MRRLLHVLLFPVAANAVRTVEMKAWGVCCCFLPHTGEFTEFLPSSEDSLYWDFREKQGMPGPEDSCPKQPDGRKSLSPRGCRGNRLSTQPKSTQSLKVYGSAKGDLPTECAPLMPHPDDMYCESYLVRECGSLTIDIPDKWKNCYRNTSDYGHNQIDPSCPQCRHDRFKDGCKDHL
ncbi:unnamed protein product [Symbiodinium microadriaticum]|nr:unnamed protein product [Symbiodinium microadriaticum]CAE7725059.1 unnamed protein product [Symbiodinium sp. KB8]